MDIYVNPNRIHTLKSSCLLQNTSTNMLSGGKLFYGGKSISDTHILSGGGKMKKRKTKRSKSKRRKSKRTKTNSMNGFRSKKKFRRFRS